MNDPVCYQRHRESDQFDLLILKLLVVRILLSVDVSTFTLFTLRTMSVTKIILFLSKHHLLIRSLCQ